MMWAVLFLAMAVSLPANGLVLWQQDTDYMDFTIMKSCFGEEVAVQLEKFTFKAGQYCEEMERNSGNSLPVNLSGQRKKRSLLKVPPNPPPSMVICNLRRLGLMTEDDEVDFSSVEDQMRKIRVQPALREPMMEVLVSCRENQVPLPDLLPGDPDNKLVKALLTIGDYFTCVIDGGMKTCRNFEMRRYFPHLQ